MSAEKLAALLSESRKTVFFGGAGVSTESGIPDFRSANGVYSERYGTLSPEEIISHDFFLSDPKTFYRFYREKMIFPDAKPNGAHIALAKLEKAGLLSSVITQNIDGLHGDAGSQNVLELHGTVRKTRCMRCGKLAGLSVILDAEGDLPRCSCGGLFKPEVTLYGENLPEGVYEKALAEVASADVLIVAGTSLSVYPAAGLVPYFHGRALVMINLSVTPYDQAADLVIREPVGQVMREATERMGI